LEQKGEEGLREDEGSFATELMGIEWSIREIEW
jgi:hypothetical protein